MGGYWDVRSCSWQGEVEAVRPDWLPRPSVPAPVDAVPEQGTAADVERLPSAPAPA